ncbi:hypothetical protein OR571_09760 [Psychrobacillus sp. NEAU-3TGS]|uniref:hypothetical protein n=1 Tax=Psychrobacillus sp. NEAU-3TGS TaxID=2995412 RepID=UPI0024976C50|nr:hypothetical protein [Psychrobacillus sp. NEAU-3TGS]MDI2587379.1 hypothetical protein [Psychrobacillus sp. NEAU-3TGS]
MSEISSIKESSTVERCNFGFAEIIGYDNVKRLVLGGVRMNIIETPYLLEEKEKHMSNVIQFENHQVLNIHLRKGEEIKEHDEKEEVLIVARKGKVLFTVKGVEQLVTTGHILHMNPLERHALKAVEDADVIVNKIGN